MKKITLFLLTQLGAWSLLGQTRFESLNFLYSIQGQQIVSGQHNDQKNLDCGASGSTGPRYWTDQVHQITGKYPALWGGDLLFHGDANLRWEMTYEAERQWNMGAIVNIMWHACPPTQGASCGWSGGLLSSLSAAQFNELLTDGSNLNTIWKQRVDEIAVHLQYLEDAGVEVFWRPYHEQNQSAFWWNSQGAQNTQRLWRMMHDYMTNDLGLTNLIWIWDVQDLSTGFQNWNAGDAYWDVLALDIYADGYSNDRYYNDMVATAGNKPIAIGECFELPSAQHLDRYPLYTFFMNWAYGLKKMWAPGCQPTNTDDYIRQVYAHPKVITLDEMPGWGKNRVPNNIAAGKTVTVSSTETGNNVAANAVDRSYGTRWSSTYSDDQWIAVDLEHLYRLDSVKITWETAMASQYELQVSEDGTNWQTVSAINNNTQAVNWFALTPTEARHLRIRGISRATAYGYSIYEIEAYGQRKAVAYGGTPVLIPAKIEAENYDQGGEGVAYHEMSAANTHGAYRLQEGVDLEACTDAGGGYNVGNIEGGEWTGYTIEVPQDQWYDFNFRVASMDAGKRFHLEINGQDISGSIQVPHTGGWQSWETVIVPQIYLTQGVHQLRLVFDDALFNLNYFEVKTPVVTSAEKLSLVNQFKVWPNPTQGEIQYRVANEVPPGAVLEIFDLTGKRIYETVINGRTGSFSLAGQPAGSYRVKLQYAQGQDSQAVILLP